MYKIIFLEESLQDLNEIYEYINKDSFAISEKVIDSILGSISNLSLFPKLGKKFNNSDYHEIIEPVFRYQIRYKIVGEIIYIITIYKFKNEL